MILMIIIMIIIIVINTFVIMLLHFTIIQNPTEVHGLAQALTPTKPECAAASQGRCASPRRLAAGAS